jgi:hypothetical protein
MMELKFQHSSFLKQPTKVPVSWIPEVHMMSTGWVLTFKTNSNPSLINSSDTGRQVDGCVGFQVAIPKWI